MLSQPTLYVDPKFLPASAKDKGKGRSTRQAKNKVQEKESIPTDLEQAVNMANLAIDALDLRTDVLHHPTSDPGPRSQTDFVFKKGSSWMSPGDVCDVGQTFTGFRKDTS